LGVFLATCGFGYAAEDIGEPRTAFIDLTAGRARADSPAANGDPQVRESGTRFVDLSQEGRSVPERSVENREGAVAREPSDTTHTVSVDLTTTPETIVIKAPLPDTKKLPAADEGDPLEARNRRAFESHVALHRRIIKPVEDVYVADVPHFVRAGVHNFLTNLESPVIFINDMLQISPSRAGNTFTRFLVNSTVGLGGVFEVAEPLGASFRDNDFGQTLAAYGVGEYPYMMIPLIGPTNPRDLSGKVVDVVINPFHYITIPGGVFTDIGQSGFHQIDARSENLDELETIEATSSDPYATERDVSRKRRNAEINGENDDNASFEKPAW
jgi:phospholipid-binding lipoprotein MlaA